MLDPNWQSPYAPSADERLANQHAVRRFALKRKLPQAIVVGVVVVALIALVSVSIWLGVLGGVVALGYGLDIRRSLARYERQGQSLGSDIREHFVIAGSTSERQRLATVLDRLSATFGVDAVTPFIVEDPGYNAALVPDDQGYVLFVTTGLMDAFELIELEGVVAHCLARQRLGLLARQGVASSMNMSDDARQNLAGSGSCYRADEVAAAAIRYPLGLAGALRKCARQVPPTGSFFLSDAYARWRWVFFDVWSERSSAHLDDLDDVELRAMALEEW